MTILFVASYIALTFIFHEVYFRYFVPRLSPFWASSINKLIIFGMMIFLMEKLRVAEGVEGTEGMGVLIAVLYLVLGTYFYVRRVDNFIRKI